MGTANIGALCCSMKCFAAGPADVLGMMVQQVSYLATLQIQIFKNPIYLQMMVCVYMTLYIYTSTHTCTYILNKILTWAGPGPRATAAAAPHGYL